MNGLGAGSPGRFQDRVHVQIAVLGRGFPHQQGFFSLLNMKGVFVGGGVHRYSADTKFVAGANDPAGDLAAVGD